METAPGQFAVTSLNKTSLVLYFGSDDPDYAVGITEQGLKLGYPPVIADDITIPDGVVGAEYNGGTGFKLTAKVQGDGPITWSMAPGSVLPRGLSLDETTGVISGTPEQVVSNHSFTVQATADGVSSTKELTIQIQKGTLEPPKPYGYPASYWLGGFHGTAVWMSVPSASGYSVQLYKDGEKCGEPMDCTDTEQTVIDYDLSGTIEKNGAGSYTITVTAKGDENWHDSQPTEQSTAVHTVTFNSNGGSEREMQLTENGGRVSAPYDPDRTGYRFAGWYSDEAFQHAWDFSKPVTSAMTLYAKWDAIPYTITMNVVTDGGSAGNAGNAVNITDSEGRPITTAEIGDAVLLTPEADYGCHFTDMKVTSGGVEIKETAEGSGVYTFTMGSANVTITARFAPCSGGDAPTYFKKSVCAVCGQEYGDFQKDETAPTGKIEMKDTGSSWTEFLNPITFDLLFKDTQTVTVTAADDSYQSDGYDEDNPDHQVKIGYYLYQDDGTGQPPAAAEELDDVPFTVYQEPLRLDPDSRYVIYAKLTDHAGNVKYISSDGIVVDQTAPAEPAVSAVSRGRTYTSGSWTDGDVVFHISGSEALSGIEKYQYSVNGTDWKDLPITNGSAELTVSEASASADGTDYLFRAVTNSGVEGSPSDRFTVRIDKTAPTAAIHIKQDKWTEFLNTVTFGKFFKETAEVTVTADDDCGGVQSVEYLLTAREFESEDQADGNWTELEADGDGAYRFQVEPNKKGSIYIRVKDAAENAAVINSEGIVVYTDAAQDTGSITYTKLSGSDVSFHVMLNGNTVKSLVLETIEEDGQTTARTIDSENYTVEGSAITLRGDYLQSLAAGTYTVRTDYNPLGESYVESADNEAPASTTVELNIQRVEGTVTIDGDTGKIYDGTAVSPVYSTNNKDGEAVVEYKAADADDAGYTTEAPVRAGVYMVRVTVKADEEGNYTEASATQDFTIGKKELTVSLKVKDKQYDGRNTAEYDEVPELIGVEEGDAVTLVSGTPAFDRVNVGDQISISLTDFSISGADAENYSLTQPSGVTADIYNTYEAEQGRDYTVNSNNWLNEDFVITAGEGYSLSLTDTADGEWSDTLSASEETENGLLEFYVRNNAMGAISTAVSESYKIDKTAPAGEITIGENGWTEFLNNITFGLFFKETQTVRIDSSDTLSGIAAVEYASSETPLTLEEVKDLTSWTDGESADVTPEDGKRFIYYARITDNAGNVVCLSTDGAEYDLTAPGLSGISDGGIYCISASFTVSDQNLKEVQIDSSPAADENGVYTLAPGEHTVRAVDKAGNSTQIKVTVNEKHTADGTGWHSDEDSHWHVCECGAIIEKADHSFTWVTDKEPTETETGAKHEECTICGFKKGAVEIPAAGTPDVPEEPSDPSEPEEPSEPSEPSKPAEPVEPGKSEPDPEVTPSVSEESRTDSADSADSAGAPGTGDREQAGYWIILLLISGAGLAGSVICRKKRNNSYLVQ